MILSSLFTRFPSEGLAIAQRSIRRSKGGSGCPIISCSYDQRRVNSLRGLSLRSHLDAIRRGSICSVLGWQPQIAFRSSQRVGLVKGVSTKALTHLNSSNSLHITPTNYRNDEEGAGQYVSQRGASTVVVEWKCSVDSYPRHFDGICIATEDHSEAKGGTINTTFLF